MKHKLASRFRPGSSRRHAVPAEWSYLHRAKARERPLWSGAFEGVRISVEKLGSRGHENEVGHSGTSTEFGCIACLVQQMLSN